MKARLNVVESPVRLTVQSKGGWVVMDRLDYEPSLWVRFWTWWLLGWKWKRTADNSRPEHP